MTDPTVRDRLAIALDVDDLDAATRLADQIAPHIGVAKVGLQLYCAAGPAAVTALRERGMAVFVDLKLHDIPTTVHKAATVLGRLGARYVTLHASGGADMLRAGVDGLATGAEQARHPVPTALAVTVLTSDTHAPHDLLQARARIAVEGGCPGVICAAPDVPTIKAVAPHLLAVTPGIRPADTGAHDQARIATPDIAITNGADVLVLGRAVTAAPDPTAAAEAIAHDVADVLTRSTASA